MKKRSSRDDLTQIPYVGKSIENDFKNIGIMRISDLKGKDPDELYSKLCAAKGHQVDRCLLYVCRSSVYFAETENPDPEKIKWWNWKNKKI